MDDMEYIIVSGIGAQALTNEINRLINKGWIPQGGVQVRTISKYESEIVQAMIKTGKSLNQSKTS